MHVLVVLVVAWLTNGQVGLRVVPYPDQEATQAECQAGADDAANRMLEQGGYNDVRATCVSLDLAKKTGV